MEIKLTERDTDMLRVMVKIGVLSTNHVRRIYKNTKRYHIKRLERLENAGYITRGYGYSQITKKGLDALGIEGAPKRLRKIDIKRRLKIARLIEVFPGWDISFSHEIKTEKRINRNAYLKAAIKQQGLSYIVYLVDSKKPRSVTLNRMWKEMQELPLKGLNHVMMLFEYPSAMGLMASRVNNPRMEELLLLPYRSGEELFNTYHSKGFKEILNKAMPGIGPSNKIRKFADYQWQGKYVSVLITNDAVKRYYLHEYYNGLSYQTEKRDVVIVCTNDQRRLFANLYPQAKISTIDRHSVKQLK